MKKIKKGGPMSIDMRHYPFSWKTRNLVRFCRHSAHESLDESFIDNFGFRDRLSRFSILKNTGTAPGPDECFLVYNDNNQRLFDKMLGLEIAFPCLKHVRINKPQLYNTMNYYRSHIEEIFYMNGMLPLPPIEGTCYMFYMAYDRLAVLYRLRNTSRVQVAVKLRWRSSPLSQAKCTIADNGFVVEDFKKAPNGCDVSISVAATGHKARFKHENGKIISAWVPRIIRADSETDIAFVIDVDVNRPLKKKSVPARRMVCQSMLQSIRNTEEAYARLPALPEKFRRFEPLVLKACGTLRTLRYMDHDQKGENIPTCHAGKCGCAATWFWDGAFTLLGLGLAGDVETAYGMSKILINGIRADGVPPVYFASGTYRYGYQQPILAWGIANLLRLRPNPEFALQSYSPLKRYVLHWLTQLDKNHNGLAESPAHCGWDDSLRWQDKFPILFRPDEPWHDKKWGKKKNYLFESVDTNTHLYLECLAMKYIASQLGYKEEARDWKNRAITLKSLIHYHFFNPRERVYQDRSIKNGCFTGMLTPASFLPVYAGITPPSLARQLCRRYLLNPERFYTPFPFPSLDRSHPAFRSGGFLFPNPAYPGALTQQSYWIGRSWPHVCYWMTGALHRSGLKQESEQASIDVLDAMNKSEAIYECYDSLTGFGNGHPEFMWSSAAVLCLAYQYYEQEPVPD